MTTKIEKLLSDKIGMSIHSIGQPSFQRVLSQQLAKFSCDLEQYSTLLEQSDAVWTSLVEAMVIPETWFFRYPESFKVFEELIKERLKAKTSAAKIQILCLPCSSGEEAYSIAITLLKAGLRSEQFCIDAIDINTQVLEQAQLGLFNAYSFRGINQAEIEHYFAPTEWGYQLKAEVITCVHFKHGNLFAPTTLPNKTYDFIFCRNLLIYFDQEKQKTAVHQLRQLLTSNGYLFSGPAEAAVFAKLGMSQLARRDSFVFANTHPQPLVKRPAADKTPLLSPLLKNKTSALVEQSSGKNHPSRHVAVRLAKTDRHTALAKASATPIPADLLQHIEQLSNAGQREQAIALCQQALNTLGPSARLFYLWGLLSDSLGLHTQAETYYRKVLYLEPSHVAALRQLAALLHARGDSAGATLLEQRIKMDRT